MTLAQDSVYRALKIPKMPGTASLIFVFVSFCRWKERGPFARWRSTGRIGECKRLELMFLFVTSILGRIQHPVLLIIGRTRAKVRSSQELC